MKNLLSLNQRSRKLQLPLSGWKSPYQAGQLPKDESQISHKVAERKDEGGQMGKESVSVINMMTVNCAIICRISMCGKRPK